MSQPGVPSPYPQPGEVLDGKFQIERLLGEGGMGAVAKAMHLLLRAPVALKFMHPQFVSYPGAVDRFLQEGVAARAIRSDHVVHVEDVGRLPSGAPYLVMACLDGKDLSQLLEKDGTPGIPVERAVHFTMQVLRGLQAAHAVGIVHRDMKPSNCFVVKHEGESDFVRILDFGISKVLQPGSQSLTQTNSALGTPLYMSPEQARSPKDVDARSDLYSVAVILYELLTGTTPFASESGEFTEILFKLFTQDPARVETLRPDLPEGLADVIHKGLARDPENRYATAKDFAEALGPFAPDRSKGVLHRIMTFEPDAHESLAPPNMLPPSAVAFSQLGAFQTRQKEPGERPYAQSEMPPDQSIPAPPAVPGNLGIQATQASHEPPKNATAHLAPGTGRAKTQVMSPGTKARASEGPTATANAVTTDVDAPMGPPKGRSPVVYMAPILGVLVLGGVGIALFGKKNPSPDAAATAAPPATSLASSPSASVAPSAATNLTLSPLPATGDAVDAGATAAKAGAPASATTGGKPPAGKKPPAGHSILDVETPQ